MGKLLPVPKRFFVTSGKAISKVSELNAFDEALIKARVGEQNLVSVSSILPTGIRKIRTVELPRGAITHCVLAQQSGNEGEMISAGIAYGFRDDDMGGYVAEGHIHGTRKALKEILTWKMEAMAELRGVTFKEVSYRIEELTIPMDHYGVCVVSLVYLF
ncbi:MAG: pyruvoyl-dependent arginine decarboxylase [Thermoplasmata archaeon]|nr:pyruvoyl-dependent arginine decarboxylase [Thermoplasmata archaeon]